MWLKTFVCVVLLGLPVTWGRAQDKTADLAIVVAKDRALDNLTSEDLKKIFRAEKSKGSDGVRFVILARDPGSPERNAALADIYQMEESDYSKYFLQATFIGLVQTAPKELSSPEAVRRYLAHAAGGIGYLRATDADDSVKIVKVDGKLPGEPGYALKIK